MVSGVVIIIDLSNPSPVFDLHREAILSGTTFDLYLNQIMDLGGVGWARERAKRLKPAMRTNIRNIDGGAGLRL